MGIPVKQIKVCMFRGDPHENIKACIFVMGLPMKNTCARSLVFGDTFGVYGDTCKKKIGVPDSHPGCTEITKLKQITLFKACIVHVDPI